jgi:hypothetical protein
MAIINVPSLDSRLEVVKKPESSLNYKKFESQYKEMWYKQYPTDLTESNTLWLGIMLSVQMKRTGSGLNIESNQKTSAMLAS